MTASKVLARFVYGSIIGILLAWGMNELTFHFLKTSSARAPKVIELVIPAGTAESVRHGEAEPSIPTGMVFVVGDSLVVRNQDSASHQLGPLFIPSGSSATMSFERPAQLSYACSFSPDDFFGLEVQLPVTASTRLLGAVFAGLPMGALIALYSLVATPASRAGAR